MELRTQAYKGGKWTSLASVSNSVIGLLRIVILARILEKADFGLMALVSMIMGFMSLFSDMGIGSAILHKQEISTKEYSSLYWLNFIVNTVLFSFICLISGVVASFYNESQLSILIPVMGINLFFSAFGRQYALITQKELHFGFISIVEISTNIISIVPAVILALNGFGVYSLIYSTLFASLFSNFFYFLKVRKEHKISLHYNFSETKPFLRIGLYQTGGQILNYFNTQFDVILIGKILGTDSLGIYNLAKNLAMRPAQIINPIVTKLSAPILSKMQNDTNALRNGYLKIIQVLSFVNFPIYFCIAVLSVPILSIAYGMSDANMAIVLSVLSFYYMLRSIGNPVSGLVVATGRTDVEFYWNIGITIFFPVFVYFGCRYSILGAGVAQLLLMILSYIPSWYFMINKLINVSLKNYSLQFSSFLFFSMIAFLLTFFFLKLFFSYSNILIFSVGFIFFGSVYTMCILLFKKEMYRFFKGLFSK